MKQVKTVTRCRNVRCFFHQFFVHLRGVWSARGAKRQNTIHAPHARLILLLHFRAEAEWSHTQPLRYRSGEGWWRNMMEKTLLICWNTCLRIEMFTNIFKRLGAYVQHLHIYTLRQAFFRLSAANHTKTCLQEWGNMSKHSVIRLRLI
jgi:hypothetical protein